MATLKPSNLWLVEDNEGHSEEPTKVASMGKTFVFHRLYKMAGSLILVLCFLIAGLWYGHAHHAAPVSRSGPAGQTPPASVKQHSVASGKIRSANTAAATPREVTVDVHGDVMHPGVIRVSTSARVADVVKAAGGFSHQGDARYVNQAAVVWDGEEIDVPNARAQAGQNGSPANATSDKSASHIKVSSANHGLVSSVGFQTRGRIDVNTADVSTLETLPGVGPARAQAIVDYRKIHGPFTSIQTLLQIRGIGAKMLAKWKMRLFISTVMTQTSNALS